MHTNARPLSPSLPDLRVIAGQETNEHERGQLLETIQTLSLELQQTLVLDELLHIFCDNVVNIIPCDSVRYDNDVISTHWQSGKTARHHCEYDLILDDVNLGKLGVTRNHPFSDYDLQVVEWLVSIAIYPIRNALLYQDALAASLCDGLTGVSNRRAFDSTVEREVDLSRRTGQPMSLIIIDIDHFKVFNDRYGHRVGDMVLKAVSSAMSGLLRKSDQLFRYGGEEFAVVLSNTDARNAMLIAERLRERVARQSVAHEGTELKVTISLGAAQLAPNIDAAQLFKQADSALYQAKDAGRNQARQAA